jgi:hypothetical protein
VVGALVAVPMAGRVAFTPRLVATAQFCAARSLVATNDPTLALTPNH